MQKSIIAIEAAAGRFLHIPSYHIMWLLASLVSLVNNLLLEVGWLGETESDLVGGELVVAVGDGVDSALHDLSVEWVKQDLLVSSSVHGQSGGSSSDVGWEALQNN
jgi:hypothetical protein